MRKNKVLTALCIIIAVIQLTAVITFANSSSSESSASNVPFVPTYKEGSFGEFLQDYAREAVPDVTVMLDLANPSASENISYGTVDGKSNVLITEEEGYVEFTVEVPATGLYSIGVDYYPIKGKSSAIERNIYINGELPYTEARAATLDRIYKDNNNEATQGAGSTMTFYSTALNEQAVKGLMDAMRVVFMDTTSGELLGIAKLDMNEVTTADKEVNGETVKAITANLYLYNYTQDPATGKLTFTTAKTDDAAVLCALQANTAKAVSAMVYLDGDYVTNEDVAAEASSMTGELNLQFASSATLVPMDYADLHQPAQGN